MDLITEKTLAQTCYSKSLSIRNYEALSMDLTINSKCLILPYTSSNIIYLCLYITVGIKHYQKGADIQKLQTQYIKTIYKRMSAKSCES